MATQATSPDPFPLTDEQRAIREVSRLFALERIRPAARGVDEADHAVPWELWHEASEVGLTDFMLPEAHGGGGIDDVFTGCVVQAELAFGDIGIGNLITSNGFFAAAVRALGDDEQRARWLEPLCGPRPPMTALAVTEPGVGSDAAALQTRARRTDEGYALSGQKAWISNAGVAGSYLVFATVDPALGARGVTAFVVDADAPGLAFGAPTPKMGQRAIQSAEVYLDDVEVPLDHRLGEEGEGFRGLMRTFDESRVTLAAACVGLARAALEYATAYARERRSFGRPIIEHQGVAFRLADMATRVDAAELLTLRAARTLDAGGEVNRQAAMAKLFASEAAMFATWGAVQTLGGNGYSREHPVERWMRDAKLEEIEEGTSDIQRLIIGRSLARG